MDCSPLAVSSFHIMLIFLNRLCLQLWRWGHCVPLPSMWESRGELLLKPSTCIASCMIYKPLWSAQAWITQFYLQQTPCLPYLISVHQMSWPGWLTCSGRFTHIVVTRRLQSERRTGLVRRLKIGVLPTVLRNQPYCYCCRWTHGRDVHDTCAAAVWLWVSECYSCHLIVFAARIFLQLTSQ